MSNERSTNDLDEIVELSYLFDFYGALLKESHREIFEDYVLNDLSLSEIASDHDITRQGVYDVVKRCKKKLRTYEDQLRLVEKFQIIKHKLSDIQDIIEKEEADYKEKVSDLAKEIYDTI